MRKIYSTFYFVSIVFSLSSCKKVIDLKLKNTSPIIVVDGQVSNSIVLGSTVKLSYTNKVNSDNTSVPLIGAAVTI